MKKNYLLLVLILQLFVFQVNSEVREVITLSNNWKFINSDVKGAEQISLSTKKWETVKIPHDWAIKGPFDKEIDKQVVQVIQDMDDRPKEQTGRTGALPYIGVGWYRNNFTLPNISDNQQVIITFDGAMSNAEVYLNGEKIGERPYGYSYFYFDITPYIKNNEENLLAVRLENYPSSSRWYPGAGLYRKVQIEIKDKVGLEKWGTFITTPYVSEKQARVNISSTINGVRFFSIERV